MKKHMFISISIFALITLFQFIFLINNLNCLIIESDKFQLIENYLCKKTLVAIDLDNTLIEPKGLIGSHQWSKALESHEINTKNGFNLNCIHNNNAFQFLQAQKNHVEIKLVDLKAKETIIKLQKRKIPLIAFTHRNLPSIGITKKQLKLLNVNFLKTAPIKEDLILDLENAPAIFTEGILFSDENPKGSVLKAFLKRINYYPKSIIMIDDQMHNLISMQKVCDELAINFIGIRYSYLDKKVKSFKLTTQMIPTWCQIN